jgi:hypothetical protein
MALPEPACRDLSVPPLPRLLPPPPELLSCRLRFARLLLACRPPAPVLRDLVREDFPPLVLVAIGIPCWSELSPNAIRLRAGRVGEHADQSIAPWARKYVNQA